MEIKIRLNLLSDLSVDIFSFGMRSFGISQQTIKYEKTQCNNYQQELYVIH